MLGTQRVSRIERESSFSLYHKLSTDDSASAHEGPKRAKINAAASEVQENISAQAQRGLIEKNNKPYDKYD
jgi:hypothetical protein